MLNPFIDGLAKLLADAKETLNSAQGDKEMEGDLEMAKPEEKSTPVSTDRPTASRRRLDGVTELTPTLKSLQDFERVQNAVHDLFERKNVQHDDAISETGVLGATVELVGCTARLKRMVLRSGDGGLSAHEKDELLDTLMDAAVYSHIALIMLKRRNWTGE